MPFAYYGFYEQNWVNQPYVAIATSSFILSTFFLSPDLDLSQSIATKNWGALRILWIGYPYLFSHRGKSHSFLFSGLTKIVYLFVVAFVLLLSSLFLINFSKEQIFMNSVAVSQTQLSDLLRQSSSWIVIHKFNVLAILAGITVSDWIHIFTDRLYSAAKKYV